MKLTRMGRFRTTEIAILSEANLTEGEPFLHLRPREAPDSLYITTTGKDRNNNYEYEILLSMGEVLEIVKFTVSAFANSKSEKAIAYSAIAALEQLLGYSSEPSG